MRTRITAAIFAEEVGNGSQINRVAVRHPQGDAMSWEEDDRAWNDRRLFWTWEEEEGRGKMRKAALKWTLDKGRLGKESARNRRPLLRRLFMTEPDRWALVC